MLRFCHHHQTTLSPTNKNINLYCFLLYTETTSKIIILMKSNYGRKGDYELFDAELTKTFLRHQNEIVIL